MSDKPVLCDENIVPSDDIIFPILGKSKSLWQALFSFMDEDHPDVTREWRYYNDGKSWLLKNILKKKTLFWTAILDKSFRTTFYFTDKAEDAIMNSGISPELKVNFKNGKRYNKIRGLTITYNTKKDLDCFKTLLEIKLAAK